ncbi:MAG: NAD(P)/FAD-dependent oxidoreductase [Thermoplasmatales archaeon]|nr:NAD(P)/FAD-dependent oxidoreductase [Thermoplasmatales archaeon]
MNLNKEYDVVVVGAGPAGLASAKSCAENNLKTLIVEEHPAIGTPVQCGEALARFVFEDLGMRPEGNEIKKIKIFSPNKKKMEIIFPEPSLFLVIERKRFEKNLAVKIVNMGVKIITRAKAVDVIKENGFVKGVVLERLEEKIRIKSKIVIDASGPNAIIARKSGLKIYSETERFDSCAQFQMSNIKTEKSTAEMYFGSFAPGGYVWIFPKDKGFANIGIGINGGEGNKALDYLRNFIEKDERLKNGSIIEMNAGIVPVGGTISKMVSNGLIVAGDAARMVNPLTGGGMRFAFKAGEFAGRVASEAVKDNDFSEKKLSEYEKLWNKEFGLAFRVSAVAKDILLGSSEKEIDSLVGDIGVITAPSAGGKDVMLKGIKNVLPVLIKRPKILFKFRKILKSNM